MRRVTWTATVLATVAATAALASAASAAPSWQCRASAGRTTLAGNPPAEPLIAGSTPCATSATGADDLPAPAGLPVGLFTAQTTSVSTTATPTNAAPAAQTITATSHVENFNLGLGLPAAPGLPGVPGVPGIPTLPSLPGLPTATPGSIGLATANAQASAVCQSGQPVMTGSSQVLGTTVGGLPTTPQQVADQVKAAFGALAPVVNVTFDEQLRTSSSLTQRAMHVEILSAVGTPLLDVVVGEARVGFGPGVCQNVIDGGPDPGPTAPTADPDPGTTTTLGIVNSATSRIQANGVRGGTCAHLTMHFAQNRKRSLTSRFGQRAVVRGRLVNCRGQSIVRGRIDVVHVVKGRKQLVKTGLRSRDGGNLTLILPRDIKTRDLRFQYRGNLNSSKVTSQSILHITVHGTGGGVLR